MTYYNSFSDRCCVLTKLLPRKRDTLKSYVGRSMPNSDLVQGRRTNFKCDRHEGTLVDGLGNNWSLNILGACMHLSHKEFCFLIQSMLENLLCLVRESMDFFSFSLFSAT